MMSEIAIERAGLSTQKKFVFCHHGTTAKKVRVPRGAVSWDFLGSHFNNVAIVKVQGMRGDFVYDIDCPEDLTDGEEIVINP